MIFISHLSCADLSVSFPSAFTDLSLLFRNCASLCLYLSISLIIPTYCMLFSNTFLCKQLNFPAEELTQPFHLSTEEGETGSSLNLRPSCSIEMVPGHPELHKGILSLTNKQVKKQRDKQTILYSPNQVALNFVLPILFVFKRRYLDLHMRKHLSLMLFILK